MGDFKKHNWEYDFNLSSLDPFKGKHVIYIIYEAFILEWFPVNSPSFNFGIKYKTTIEIEPTRHPCQLQKKSMQVLFSKLFNKHSNRSIITHAFNIKIQKSSTSKLLSTSFNVRIFYRSQVEAATTLWNHRCATRMDFAIPGITIGWSSVNKCRCVGWLKIYWAPQLIGGVSNQSLWFFLVHNFGRTNFCQCQIGSKCSVCPL